MKLVLLSVLLTGMNLFQNGNMPFLTNYSTPPVSGSLANQEEKIILSLRLLDKDEHIVYFCAIKNEPLSQALDNVLEAASKELDGNFMLELHRNGQADKPSEIVLRKEVAL